MGNFVGPSLKILQPTINFGLVKSFGSTEVELDLENQSEIPCEFLFRLFNNTDVDFESKKKQ